MQNKILLIDDDEDDIAFLLDVITEMYPSCTPVTACNGKEALDHIEKNPPPPSLVFLDLNMPLMNGYEFLVSYKKNAFSDKSHVIIYSTSSHPKDITLTKELGAADFITKVSDLQALKQNIRKVVEQLQP